MPSVRIWTPESDYDRDAVCCIAKKIVDFYQCELKIEYATKQGYNEVTRKPDGLKKAVEIYLKNNDLVIFLIDADGIQSQAQRSREQNSLFNKIQAVVKTSEGKVKLIIMLQELEAWLLVDCLGICCYFTDNSENRINQKWIKFARRKQPGKTNLITEAESGGSNAKEYLTNLSREILIEKNSNLKDKLTNLKKLQYDESKSDKVAEFIQINNQTINRNDSLEEFANTLKLLANNKLGNVDTSQ